MHVSEESTPNQYGDHSGATHGTFGGHQVTGKTYKGRYEVDTGRLSVVRPAGPAEFRPIPQVVMSALRDVFPGITKVYEF